MDYIYLGLIILRVLNKMSTASRFEAMMNRVRAIGNDPKQSHFYPKEYIALKIKAINKWCIENNINTFVIGVSGGIDSAVTYRLIELASQQYDSPIKKIVPLSMPISGSAGTTGQVDAIDLAKELVHNIEVIELGQVADLFHTTIEAKTEFAKGQLDYYLRPAAMYGKVAMLQTDGWRPVVCGTINGTELFLGYFGKKTDPCDVILIHDLTKRQVYQISHHLGIPSSIKEAKPSGGVSTGQTDEELIGATYEEIEAFMYLSKVVGMTDDDIYEQYEVVPFENILKQRNSNRHKFKRPIDSDLIDIKP